MRDPVLVRETTSLTPEGKSITQRPNFRHPANSPNSIPPERVFSILNDTFDDDQASAMADYKELSLQLQFNERSRKKERGE